MIISFYFNKARDLGKGYVRSVARAHSRALIDSATAAKHLDAKVGQIPRALLRSLGSRRCTCFRTTRSIQVTSSMDGATSSFVAFVARKS